MSNFNDWDFSRGLGTIALIVLAALILTCAGGVAIGYAVLGK